MMRVGVCRGQSSSWLWHSICHNLRMIGLRQLTTGSGMGLQSGRFPWGPKHSYVGPIYDDKRTNEVGLNFVCLLCVGQEDKVIDGEVGCSGFLIKIFFTDHGGCIKGFLQERYRSQRLKIIPFAGGPRQLL
uniref:Uncharacterized protein n=1 Tax=Romanomermis culicivorax TaxID=13658 RepID=A0A915I907_ROMCU